MFHFAFFVALHVPRHLMISTEVETLCHINFAGDIKITFSGTQNYIQTFCVQYVKQNITMCEHRRKNMSTCFRQRCAEQRYLLEYEKFVTTVLSADDHMVLTTSRNELQILVYNLNKTAQRYDLKISSKKPR
jgi:hypothetical protein